MAIETDVLVELLKVDALHDETDIVKGIAQRAADQGFETLSTKQQGVISHLLSRECDGATDPGGYHNNCQVVLTDQSLVDATVNSGYFGDWLCEDCRNESEGYERERERFMAE